MVYELLREFLLILCFWLGKGGTKFHSSVCSFLMPPWSGSWIQLEVYGSCWEGREQWGGKIDVFKVSLTLYTNTNITTAFISEAFYVVWLSCQVSAYSNCRHAAQNVMYLYIFSTVDDLWNVNGQQHTFDFLWTGSSLVAGKN